MNYLEFLKTKIEIAPESGFELEPEKINKALKPHQRDAVLWALKGGRRALFESFGLGKTVQELEFCKQAAAREGGKALIVLPLGVKQEFTKDSVSTLHYPKPEYCRTMDEVKAFTGEASKILGYENAEYCSTMGEVHKSKGNMIITNYERVRDGDIRPDYFCATSLDEASVLRSFGSKTDRSILHTGKHADYSEWRSKKYSE